jgi:hypothetical protein
VGFLFFRRFTPGCWSSSMRARISGKEFFPIFGGKPGNNHREGKEKPRDNDD